MIHSTCWNQPNIIISNNKHRRRKNKNKKANSKASFLFMLFSCIIFYQVQ